MLERAGTRSPLSIPTVDEIRDRACAFAFGKAVVENSNRGLVAEIIVEAAIGPEWELCSGDWGGWDFEYVSDRARRPVAYLIDGRDGQWRASSGSFEHLPLLRLEPTVNPNGDVSKTSSLSVPRSD